MIKHSKPQAPINGFELWRGSSHIDGSPIVAIATGLGRKSANEKTGSMIQTWILPQAENPFAAIHNGTDYGICGDCPLRGIIRSNGTDTRNVGRACYVNVAQAPYQVWNSWQRGNYPKLQKSDLARFKGRMLRLGSYGEPVAVPYSVWAPLCKVADGRTGYTHQWRDRSLWRFRRLLMASCETVADAELARSRGWRTFRTSADGEVQPGEFMCPASKEAGKRLTCEECGACNGADRRAERVSVTIKAHGSPATLGSYGKLHAIGGTN